jgi:hypothetical protein
MKRQGHAKTAKESSSFQDAIERVEALPFEEQALILEIINHRILEQRRADLIHRVAEAREEYRNGRVSRGKVNDILAEVDS